MLRLNISDLCTNYRAESIFHKSTIYIVDVDKKAFLHFDFCLVLLNFGVEVLFFNFFFIKMVPYYFHVRSASVTSDENVGLRYVYFLHTCIDFFTFFFYYS